MSATPDSVVRLAVAGVTSAIAEAKSPQAYILILQDTASGATIYCSNGDREEAIAALEELIQGLKRGEIDSIHVH